MSEEDKQEPGVSGRVSEPKSGFAAFWAELKRRKVVRVAITYAVVAWLLIQIAATVFPQLGMPDWAPRMVTLLLLIGFPIAVIIAWAFELTPDGIKTTSSADEGRGDTPVSENQQRKRNRLSLLFATAIPTFIFGALAIFFYFRSDTSAPTPSASSPSSLQVEDLDKSIAVLPFANRSNREEDQFFTDGIHDDLLTQISRIREIRTLARTSVLSYRDTTKRMTEIGEELGVKWLLEGGVQRGGNEIRINAQLIEVANEGHVWAETYTRDLTAENIFEIQDEITKAIAQALRVVLSLEEQERIQKLPTDNIAALEAYFKGKESLAKRNLLSRREALSHFEEAISLDPDFALAHAVLASAMVRGPIPDRYQPEKAAIHTSRALALDDSLSEAYISLGLLKDIQGDREAAIVAFKKALELDPKNAESYRSYARFLSEIRGHIMEVSDLYRTAYELDPKHQGALAWLAFSFEASGKWDQALETRQREVAENPNGSAALRELARLYQDLGHWDEAIISIRKHLARNPTDPVRLRNLSVAYANLGDVEQAISLGNRHLEAFEIPVVLQNIESLIYSLTGDETLMVRSALEGLKNNSSHPALLGRLTEPYIRSGKVDELMKLWKQGYPTLFSSSTALDVENAYVAQNVVRILLATGQAEQANHLIEKALAFFRTQAPNRYSHLEEAVLHAVAGDDRKALDAIRRCLDAGGSPYELMEYGPLKPFESNPEYQAMAEKRKAELAIQLKRVQDMEANGELPPIPDNLGLR